MTRRSAMNPRYQKNTAPAGKTRRSAASAKASRSIADTKKKSARQSKPTADKVAQQAYMSPDTAEYRRLRKLWWTLLGVAFALIVVSMLVQYVAKNVQLSLWFSWTSVGIIAVVYYLDFSKIRPLRKAAYEAAKKGKSVSSTESKKSGS